MSSVSQFHLILTDVNDNPPRLAKDYTDLFFCHPLSAPGSLIFEATDDDQQFFRGPHFTFSIASESLQNDWQVSKINGTHARLSTRHTDFEEREYVVLIRINDGVGHPWKALFLCQLHSAVVGKMVVSGQQVTSLGCPLWAWQLVYC